MATFYRTSILPHHEFRENKFWHPFCTYCHERRRHPIHSTLGEMEVCGYDACRYCGIKSDPTRGVPSNRKKG